MHSEIAERAADLSRVFQPNFRIRMLFSDDLWLTVVKWCTMHNVLCVVIKQNAPNTKISHFQHVFHNLMENNFLVFFITKTHQGRQSSSGRHYESGVIVAVRLLLSFSGYGFVFLILRLKLQHHYCWVLQQDHYPFNSSTVSSLFCESLWITASAK